MNVTPALGLSGGAPSAAEGSSTSTPGTFAEMLLGMQRPGADTPTPGSALVDTEQLTDRLSELLGASGENEEATDTLNIDTSSTAPLLGAFLLPAAALPVHGLGSLVVDTDPTGEPSGEGSDDLPDLPSGSTLAGSARDIAGNAAASHAGAQPLTTASGNSAGLASPTAGSETGGPVAATPQVPEADGPTVPAPGPTETGAPTAPTASAPPEDGVPVLTRPAAVAADLPIAPTAATAVTAPAPPAAPTVAPTVSTTAGGAPVDTTAATQQVAEPLGRLVSRGDGTHKLTIKLTPEALGEVRLTVTIKAGEVTVAMSSSPEAAQALRAGSSDLRRALEAMGLNPQSVDIRDLPAGSQGRPNSSYSQPDAHGNQSQHPGATHTPQPGDAAEPDVTPTEPHNPNTTQRVDLTV